MDRRPVVLVALALVLSACTPPEDTAAEDPGIEPASAMMLASAKWVWVSGGRWVTYQQALIPLLFSADVDTRASGARSEHCRVLDRWTDQQAGVSPIRIETSALSATASWDADGYYDFEGLEGDDPFASSGDTLVATAEGLEASVAAPADVPGSDVLGDEAGFDTPVYAEGFDLVWSWITGSETVGSIYCVVEVSELAEGELGPEGTAVPEDGQDLWAEQGHDSEELFVGLATSTTVEGFFDDPIRLMAGRVFKMEPQ